MIRFASIDMDYQGILCGGGSLGVGCKRFCGKGSLGTISHLDTKFLLKDLLEERKDLEVPWKSHVNRSNFERRPTLKFERRYDEQELGDDFQCENDPTSMVYVSITTEASR
jgi:hypothetical protein